MKKCKHDWHFGGHSTNGYSTVWYCSKCGGYKMLKTPLGEVVR